MKASPSLVGVVSLAVCYCFLAGWMVFFGGWGLQRGAFSKMWYAGCRDFRGLVGKGKRYRSMLFAPPSLAFSGGVTCVSIQKGQRV